MELLKNSEIDLIWTDDQKDILDLSKMAIERQNDDFNIITTTNPEEALEIFEKEEVDAIISDYDMPEMTGVELLKEIRSKDCNIPFILYTGKGTEEVASDALNAGATGYFQKEAGLDQYKVISEAIRNSVDRYFNLERSSVFGEIVENIEMPVVVTDTNSKIVYTNPAFEEVTGYSLDEILGENPNILSSEYHSEEFFEEMYAALNDGEVFEIQDMVNFDKNGEEYVHDQFLTSVNVHGEEPDYFAGISTVKNNR